MLLAVMPLPRPDMIPPVTTMYCIPTSDKRGSQSRKQTNTVRRNELGLNESVFQTL